MAAGTWSAYSAAIARSVTGGIDWDGHTFVCALFGTGYTPDLNADDDLADIVTHEIADGDYARQTLGTATVTTSGGTTTAKWANISFGTDVTIGAKWAGIFDDTHASDALVAVVDLNTAGTESVAQSTTGTFQVTIDSAGVMQFRRA